MKRAIPLFTLLTLVGCISRTAQAPPPIPERNSLPLAEEKIPHPTEGAIFNAKSKNLYQDDRACRVGDVVLVKIVEVSNGQKNAETKNTRTSSVTGGISSLFGFEKKLLTNGGLSVPSLTSIDGGLSNSYDGKAQTNRDSTVTATLSARVTEVTMNGNLKIQGYQEVRVNNEAQHIILSGIIRPADIAKDNSIVSSNIADARIEYSGTGTMADIQEPGWLGNALNAIWPF
jgi:flagellar L-ring protein precursor FlgH